MFCSFVYFSCGYIILNYFIVLEVTCFQTSDIEIFNAVVLQTENGNKVNPWFIFNDCFQVGEEEKNPVMMEVPTLSQLQQNTFDKLSQCAAISRYKSWLLLLITMRS